MSTKQIVGKIMEFKETAASISQPLPPPKAEDYLYQDVGGRSGYYLTHTGDCADLGINSKNLEVSVAWNDAQHRIDAHITGYQDYDNNRGIKIPKGFGCIQHDTVLGAEYMLTPGPHRREFYEKEYGFEAIEVVEQQGRQLAQDKGIPFRF